MKIELKYKELVELSNSLNTAISKVTTIKLVTEHNIDMSIKDEAKEAFDALEKIKNLLNN